MVSDFEVALATGFALALGLDVFDRAALDAVGLLAFEDALTADGFSAGFALETGATAFDLATASPTGFAGVVGFAGLEATAVLVGFAGALFGLATLEEAADLALAAALPGAVLAGALADTATGFALATVAFDLAAAPDNPDFDVPDLVLATFELDELEPIFDTEGLPDLPDIASNAPCAEVTFKFKVLVRLNQALLNIDHLLVKLTEFF